MTENRMRRVVITGMGIVSPLGDTLTAVLSSLQESRSGIHYHEPYREIGLRSHLGGFTQVNLKEQIDKKNLRFMGNAAAYACAVEGEHLAVGPLVEHATQVAARSTKYRLSGCINSVVR